MRQHELDFEHGRPLLMGIVNAGPDSFSDPGPRELDGLLRTAHELTDAGASLVDVGGESGRSDRQAVSEDEESSRIVPLVERLAGEGVAVSVDTWRAGPARAALDAGASMLNDVSALSEPVLADLCAQTGAGLVITHTRTAPKTKEMPGHEDVVADAAALLAELAATAQGRGVGADTLLLDPGLDLGKTPAESVEVLRRIGELEALGRPLLLAVSRKDFLGAITGRPPAGRDAATLAAIEPALDLAGAVVRVHDVAAAADFLAVRASLRGDGPVPGEALDPSLRTEAIA
jgi:dihydropteroate synthase